MARGRTAHDETENNSDRSNSELLLPRRSYLALAGVTAGALGGVNAATAAAPESNYEQVVDVTDVGADPSGGDPIDDVLEAHVSDDTLVRFPEGRYRLAGQTFEGLHNVAFVGQDATLVPDDGSTGLLTFTSARDLVVAGFTTDAAASEGTATLAVHATGGENAVREYAVTGSADDPALEVSVGGEARLDVAGVRLTDGGTTSGIAVSSNADGDGAILLEDCAVEGWTDGLSVSGHDGPLQVLGGRFADSSRSQIRVRGGTSARTVLRNVTVDVDAPGPRARNVRGTWFEAGGELLVDDSDVRMRSLGGAHSAGAVVQGTDAGRLVVRNSRVRTDADAVAIRGKAPAGRVSDSKGALVCQSVSLTGEADGRAAVQVVGRDGTTLDDLCIHQSGADRTGIRVVDAEDVSVTNAGVDVTGSATEFVDSTVVTANVSGEADCPEPTDSGGSDAETAASTRPHRIAVAADDGEATFSFAASGEVERQSATPSGADVVVDGGTVDGEVGEDAVGFLFDGELLALDVDGGTATLDGERIDGAEFPDEPLGNVVEVVADEGDLVNYTFSVDGRLAHAGDEYVEDNIYGKTVEGVVAGSADSYAFAGSITDFRWSGGDATVRIDGVEVDAGRVAEDGGSTPATDVSSRFVADGTDGSSYAFAATGETAELAGDSSERAMRVAGTADGGVDAFRFDGDVDALRLDGTGVLDLR